MTRALVEAATVEDVDALVAAWLALAEEQRAHDSRVRAEANRQAIHEDLSRRAVLGEALVARQADDDRKDGELEGRWLSLAEPPEPDAIVEAGRLSADVLGFVSFGRAVDGFERDGERGVVHNLYVRPGARERGVGRALLAAAEAELAAAGVDTVTLEALAANDRALAFYRRAGYREHRVELEKPVD